VRTRVIEVYPGFEVQVNREGTPLVAVMRAPTPYENWVDAMELVNSSERIRKDIQEAWESIDDWDWCKLTHEHDYMTGT
jgi:hypothetical protein